MRPPNVVAVGRRHLKPTRARRDARGHQPARGLRRTGRRRASRDPLTHSRRSTRSRRRDRRAGGDANRPASAYAPSRAKAPSHSPRPTPPATSALGRPSGAPGHLPTINTPDRERSDAATWLWFRTPVRTPGPAANAAADGPSQSERVSLLLVPQAERPPDTATRALEPSARRRGLSHETRPVKCPVRGRQAGHRLRTDSRSAPPVGIHPAPRRPRAGRLDESTPFTNEEHSGRS